MNIYSLSDTERERLAESILTALYAARKVGATPTITQVAALIGCPLKAAAIALVWLRKHGLIARPLEHDGPTARLRLSGHGKAVVEDLLGRAA